MFMPVEAKVVILDHFFSKAKQLGDTGNGYAGIRLHKFNNLSPSFISNLFLCAFFRLMEKDCQREWIIGGVVFAVEITL